MPGSLQLLWQTILQTVCLLSYCFNKKLSCRRDRATLRVIDWIFREVTQDYSRSFEMTLLSAACPYQSLLLFLFHSNCLYLVPFLRYSASKNGMTLQPRVGVVQGHWKCRRSIDHIRLLLVDRCKYRSMPAQAPPRCTKCSATHQRPVYQSPYCCVRLTENSSNPKTLVSTLGIPYRYFYISMPLLYLKAL